MDNCFGPFAACAAPTALHKHRPSFSLAATAFSGPRRSSTSLHRVLPVRRSAAPVLMQRIRPPHLRHALDQWEAVCLLGF
ncbi:hypothetical protein WJX84_004973 [Apatococcus fuscideae]|uniref:Uncharacterized protein n=1 Tax=Apatococcus fuscideae TaxID=2026836 RepID=A0AAW1T5C9_9CHLO